ncbi:MAG: hypothetical protein ACK5N0_04360 [Synechococcaceae cyanobacterium]
MTKSSRLRNLANASLDRIGDSIHRSIIDLCRELPAFTPNSTGDHSVRSQLTLQAANATFPCLSRICTEQLDLRVLMRSSQQFAADLSIQRDDQVLLQLENILNHYGSDKATLHDYHYIYAAILKDLNPCHSILEIGLGTNNPAIVSNMHGGGSPGGSLRAFRDYLPQASVFGADIDPAVLFQEDRIQTFQVDQLSPKSLEQLGRSLPPKLDLIIDDGLHAPDANINTLGFALSHVRAGGWVVIEDIAPAALEIWNVVGAVLQPNHQCWIIQAKEGLMFVVKTST